jgi:anti-anti-sigma factor
MSPPATLALQGALTIAQAAAQRELLLHAIRPPQCELRLDLAAVDAFDSAGVQLLLAARRTLEARGGGLVLQAAAPVVREVLQTYGLQALLPAEPH